MITAVLLISFLSFVGLGLPDGLLGVAWPSIRAEFGRPMGAIVWLFASVSLGYFVSSVSSGPVVRRVDLGWALVGGALAMAAGLMLVALVPWWWMLVPGFVLIGVGTGLIDAGFNAYAAHCFSATTMNWMHACFGIGATVGPPMVTLSILQLGSWRYAYVGASVVLWLVTLMLLRTRDRFSHRAVAQASAGAAHRRAAPATADRPDTEVSPVVQRLLIWGGVLLFFFYTGAEISAAQLTYTLLTEGRGMQPVSASFWVGAFWFSLTGGRILLGPLSQIIGSRAVLRGAFAAACIAALVLSLGLSPTADGLALAALGASMAPVFPLLILESPGRVGASRANDVIGYQMGAAILSSVLLAGGGGMLAQRVGMAVVAPYILLLLLLGAGLFAVLTVLQRSVVQ
ncbi:MAG: MFS transporter [Spirochaetaceae bacterium]|nr:MAG: MFS transporter [Spirochaetaceae bacterium]